jgi:pullulanase/glycogen debranching enzyme
MVVTTDVGVAIAGVVGAGSIALSPGEPWPLGAHGDHDGTNFAVFSRHSMFVELWVFADAAASVPSMRVELDRIQHRTGDIWHVRLRADLRGHSYLFRATGSPVADRRVSISIRLRWNSRPWCVNCIAPDWK